MKLERNLFFRGHRKIVFFFFNRGEVGWGGGRGQGEGRRQVVKVGGGLRGRRVFARCSQTDKQGQIDRRGEEWGRQLVGGERREEEEGETVCFVMSE